MADAARREEKLKAARETFKQLQKKKAGGKGGGAKAKKPKDDKPKEPEQPEVSAEPEVTESIAPEVVHDESPVNKTVEIPTTGDPVKDYSELHELRTRLTDKDSQLSSLQEELSALKSQEEKYKRDISQHTTSLASKDKEIASLKSSDSEKDSLISSLQLELGQLQSQLTSLKESTGSAPTSEQFALLSSERSTLQSQLTAANESLSSSQKELQSLQAKYTALEKDTKTTHDALTSLRNDHAKLKDTHSSEIQKSRLSHSRASELQLENKTLLSRVEELKQKVVSLTSEKVELVERTDSLEKELYKLRKVQASSVAGGGGERKSVELNAELDQLIQGQETRDAIRQTNQRRYSQFVGQATDVPQGGEGETMREINERRLKKGKDSGEFGREKEVGFVIDLVTVGGGCGMCVGDVLTL